MNNQAILHDPELGEIRLHVNRRAARFIARWRGGHVELTVPPFSSPADVRNAVESLKPRLLAKRPEIGYAAGQTIRLEGLTITVDTQRLRPGSIIVRAALPESRVSVGTDIDMADPASAELIAGAMRRIAHCLAPQLLLPRARQLAERFGCRPQGWAISSGRRILGTCRADRTIRLSSACVFLPADLRDYIICHELAHLSEMNHGTRFHDICNSYCGGRERELTAKLRHFKWPV